LRVGDRAPAFELDGVDGATGERDRFRLDSGVGGPQVLVFYPADDTPVCTQQLVSYTDGIADLRRVGARVLALSPQSLDSHEEFARRHGGFAFPLLSDPGSVVGDAYGIIGLLGLYRRSIFVIDAEGLVRFMHRAIGPGLAFVPVDKIVSRIEGLGG